MALSFFAGLNIDGLKFLEMEHMMVSLLISFQTAIKCRNTHNRS